MDRVDEEDVVHVCMRGRAEYLDLILWTDVEDTQADELRHMNIQEHVRLAPFTTLGIGGDARFFARCASVEQICEALDWASTRSLPVHILGGGSNTLFSDEGLEGLVLRVELHGVDIDHGGGQAQVRAAAGEDWDRVVKATIEADLVGIECLSGIPGFVGATPIQNVGAYGQEISHVLVEIDAIDRRSLEQVTFDGAACEFAYRDSRFKGRDRDRYLVTHVTYRLAREIPPRILYPELERQLEAAQVDLHQLAPGRVASEAVRDVVLSLRRSKAMVVDRHDPNTRSAGSFFLNPLLSDAEYEAACRCWLAFAGAEAATIPSYARQDGEQIRKVPAAWLVEQAGFKRFVLL